MLAVASALIDDWDDRAINDSRPLLGVPEDAYLHGSTALDVFEAQLYVLERAGYCIKRLSLLDDIDAINARHQDLIAAELALEHQTIFAQHSGLYRARTADLIRYGQTDQRRPSEGSATAPPRFPPANP